MPTADWASARTSDFVWEAPSKEEINVSLAIRKKVQLYLSEAFGLYELAAELADEDLYNCDQQIKQDEKMGFVFDDDLAVERDLTLAATEVIYSSPYWEHRNSIDPGYEAFERQNTLTEIAAGA